MLVAQNSSDTADSNKMGWNQSRRIKTQMEASDEGRECWRNIVEMTTTEVEEGCVVLIDG